MGLLTNLLTAPVLGPIRFVTWIAQNVLDQAERELYDEDTLRGKLTELELQYEIGEITEEQYAAAEEALLERLRVSAERKRQL